MVFEYTPSVDQLSEDFWVFSIPSQGISVPFLLVGLVAEPRVAFDRPAINFGQVQLGVRGKQVRTGGRVGNNWGGFDGVAQGNTGE
jgi:hypothetical protein